MAEKIETDCRRQIISWSLIVLSALALLSTRTYSGPLDPLTTLGNGENGDLSWTSGLTSLSHLTPAEFHTRLGTRPPRAIEDRMLRNEPIHSDPTVSFYQPHYRLGTTGSAPSWIVGVPSKLPDSWDWRSELGVTAVKDQGNCGSCWDFAATAAFESAILIREGIELDLSEQQVLDCNSYHDGCSGGWMTSAYEHHMRRGAVAEECIPYLADDSGICVENGCQILDRIEGHYSINPTVRDIKRALLSGPVVTVMGVVDEFKHYTGGCYSNDDYVTANHSVLIVGWDDSACDDHGVWIVKNSWGSDWGDDGFFKIRYNTCQIGYGAGSVDYLPKTGLVLSHLPLDDQPSSAQMGYRVEAEIMSISNILDSQSPTLSYRINFGEFVSQPMTPGETDHYWQATIPSQSGTNQVDYYISASDLEGRRQSSPLRAPSLFFSFLTGYDVIWQDDLEGESLSGGAWSHQSTFAGSGDQWHLSETNNNTADGNFSWKCGAEGYGEYENSSDGSLVLSLESVPPYSQLRFSHWINAESDPFAMGWAFDGGVVDVSTDGGAIWERLTPENGYSYLVQRGSYPGPYAEGMPLFSGSEDWREERIDLTGYEGELLLRFRFASDGAISYEGWHIDDIKILAPSLGAPPAAVLVPYFNLSRLGQGIEIKWQVSETSQYQGFHIERGHYEEGPFERISESMISIWDYVTAADSFEGNTYQFIDSEPSFSSGQFYRLIGVDHIGEEHSLGILSSPLDQISAGATMPRILPLGPNPFTSSTDIRFILPETSRLGEADLGIFDSEGRLVAHPVNREKLPSGTYSRNWDGSNLHGVQLEAGVYYLRLRHGTRTAAGSITLIR